MKRRNIILAIGLFGFLFLNFSQACKRSSAKETENPNPNIVLVLADDMGYGDSEVYNSASKIATPNIDLLASEGIRFTDAHAPASICTPTRYGLLTGRYCWRTRVKRGVILGYDEDPLIEKGRSTLASLLKDVGYRTAAIGKWHLGMNWETKDGYVIKNDSNKWASYTGVFKENEENIDFTKPTTGGPRELGFDYFFGTLGCSTSDNPYCFIENDKTVGIPSVMLADKWIGLPGVVTARMEPSWSMEEVDLVYTQKAIDFIDEHMAENPKDPFFVYLALSSPHIPFLPPDFTKGKSLEGPRGDLVLVADWSLGEINKTLEKYNLSDNTLLIFTSDNGPRKGNNGHLSAGEFRGVKGTIWEGGLRVPFIARWPGNIETGIASDQTISLTDMLASFANLTGQTLKKGAGEDSYNVLPAILGQKIENNDSQVRIFHSAAGVFAVRQGPWKLIVGTKGAGRKPIDLSDESQYQVGQLYNLETDPYETIDLFEKEPELVLELINHLKRIMESN